MVIDGFVGPAYQARSPVLAADQAINVYVESRVAPAAPKQQMLLGTPGLRRLASVNASGCRGSSTSNGRTFTVIGPLVYEFTLSGTTIADGVTATLSGGIADDGKPVSWSFNGQGGHQIALCGGGQLKIFDTATNTWTAPISLPMTNPPIQVDFIDGYFLLLERDSLRIFFSALEDGTAWDALDFFARSTTADTLVGMKVFRHQIWRFGNLTTDVCYDSGDADNPFQSYPGSVMQMGATTPWAIGILAESIVWLGQTTQGHASFVRAADYTPSEIGTPATAYALGQYARLDDAELLVYEQDAHQFAVWTFPSSGESWAFDAMESGRQQTPIWHQRSTWNSALGIWQRWRARGLVAAFGALVVGDYANGHVYELDLDTFEDDGGMIRRVRRGAYLSAESQFAFIDQVELGVQLGVGLVSGQGVNPVVMLAVSRDSGLTWGPARTAPIGALGQYGARAIWRRLGRARVDRVVFEVSQTDPVRCAWAALWLRATPGSGAL
jgi:hypothetical protein